MDERKGGGMSNNSKGCKVEAIDQQQVATDAHLRESLKNRLYAVAHEPSWTKLSVGDYFEVKSPDCWFSDTIIKCLFNYWSIYYDESDSYIALLDPSVSSWYQAIGGGARLDITDQDRNSIQGKRFLFIAVNDAEIQDYKLFHQEGKHWSLLVIDVLENIAHHYNSLPEHSSQQAAAKRAMSGISKVLREDLKFHEESNTPHQGRDNLYQADSGACGAFVVFMVETLLRDHIFQPDNQLRSQIHLGLPDKFRLTFDSLEERRKITKMMDIWRWKNGNQDCANLCLDEEWEQYRMLIAGEVALPEEDKVYDNTESDRDSDDEYVVVLEGGNDRQAAGRDDEHAQHKRVAAEEVIFDEAIDPNNCESILCWLIDILSDSRASAKICGLRYDKFIERDIGPDDLKAAVLQVLQHDLCKVLEAGPTPEILYTFDKKKAHSYCLPGIYVHVIYDPEDSNVLGVYIGSAVNVGGRIQSHYRDRYNTTPQYVHSPHYTFWNVPGREDFWLLLASTTDLDLGMEQQGPFLNILETYSMVLARSLQSLDKLEKLLPPNALVKISPHLTGLNVAIPLAQYRTGLETFDPPDALVLGRRKDRKRKRKKLYLSRPHSKFARAADPGKGDHTSVWVICSRCNDERSKFLHKWPRYDIFSGRYIRVRRYCKVCARKGQVLFKPADASTASTTTAHEMRRDLRNRAKDGDPEAITKMDEKNTQRRIQHYNNRERADNGDEELKAKMEKRDERLNKEKREKERNLRERLKNGNPEAKDIMDKRRAYMRAYTQKYSREAKARVRREGWMEKIQNLRQSRKLDTLTVSELIFTVRAKGFAVAHTIRRCKDQLVQKLEEILNAENVPHRTPVRLRVSRKRKNQIEDDPRLRQAK